MQKELTAEQVLAALQANATVAKAAAAVGVSERTFYRRMDAFGIRHRRVPVREEAA